MKKFFTLLFLILCLNSKLITKNIERIVSLGPYITKSIYLLDSGDKIIANTIYCIYPEDAKNKIKIGNLLNINIEKIYSLKPDIVIYTSLSNPEQIKKLQRLGIKVFFIDQPKNFEEMKKQLLELGKILGKEKKAEEIIKNTEKRIKKILKSIPDKKPKVFIQIGFNPLFTVTSDSFINDLIKRAGGINIAENAKSGLYSMEDVIKQNPDIILISLMGEDGKIAKKEWLKFKNVNAVKNKRIYFIDEYKICSPTIVEFVETLEYLIKIFYRDVKK